MTIDEINSYYNTKGISAVNNIAEVQKVESDDDNSTETVGSVSAGNRDTYVSTISAQDTELRSENYNDILDQIRKARAAKSETAATASSDSADYATTSAATTSDSTAASEAGGVSGGGSGGDSSEDDEEETTTIVVINGQKYLETTTTNSDGTTTVTRTPIGASDSNDTQTPDFSAAAQAVTL